jgi:hypothetical protein
MGWVAEHKHQTSIDRKAGETADDREFLQLQRTLKMTRGLEEASNKLESLECRQAL